MNRPKKRTFIEHFSSINDPRLQRKQRHSLEAIFFIALCAVICGCDGWVAVEKFGNMKKTWFEKFLALEHGIPSHDTFGRVFSLIAPTEFQSCFSRWIQAIVEDVMGDVIAIDGKCLRGSYDNTKGKAAIHMVSAWSCANQLVLGQVKVDEKSNEITALPLLLEKLDMQGAIVTADAMHTQTKSAQAIVSKGADYVLALKGNRSRLHDDVTLFFEQTPKAYALTYDKTTEADHGRIEQREVWVCNDVAWLEHHDFPHLSSIIKVKARRYKKGTWSEEERYYISSLSHDDAAHYGQAIRQHWGVETQLHYCLDVIFDEDRCRIRKGHADENMATLRHLALNLLKAEKTAKVGLKIKRQMAGWDEQYLLKILDQF